MTFNLGKTVVTRGIADAMEINKKFSHQVKEALGKYVKCDWGDTCKEDAAMNNKAAKDGDDRILAVYHTCEGDIWIITEWDRSVTTILFPSEY